MISSKIKAVRNLKNTIVLIFSFSLSKVDECTCRVLWPLYDFLSKIGFDPVLDGQPPTSKNLGLASDPFWSIALSNLLQPHSLWRSLCSASGIPLATKKDLKLCTSQFDEFFYEAAAFRTKGNSRVCCWSVQHCTVKASKNEGQQQEGGPRLLLEVAHTGDFSA